MKKVKKWEPKELCKEQISLNDIFKAFILGGLVDKLESESIDKVLERIFK